MLCSSHAPILVILLTSLPYVAASDSAIFHILGGITSYVDNGEFKLIPTVNLEPDLHLAVDASAIPIVSTTSGDLVGSTLPEAHAFYSIPYAAPPIGKLRFRAPEPVVRSEGWIDVTEPDYVVCHQRPHDECGPGWCYTNQNEDCLVLNIHVPLEVDLYDPERPPEDKLPVLVWIHGGAFFGGTGTSSKTDGRFLSDYTSSVVVVINYRIGPYGFLVYDRGGESIAGNQGLKDQQMALSWVQENIAKFGGDKDRVTIFGESAGAQSVMWHLMSKVSQPLFHRAILESNAAVFPHMTTKESMSTTDDLLEILECTNRTEAEEFECLMNAPTEKLDQIGLMMGKKLSKGDAWSTVEPYRPVIDGVEFTEQPLTMFKQGKWNRDKQFIAGANTQEVEILQFYIPDRITFTWDNFLGINKLFFGDVLGEKTANYYNSKFEPDGEDYRKILGVEAGDAFFICPTRAMLRLAHKTAENPLGNYFYINGHPASGEYCIDVMLKPEVCGYAYHSSEIPFVFWSGPLYGYLFDENDEAVSSFFSYYWGNFAANGDPNSGGVGHIPYFPPYESSGDLRDLSSENAAMVYIQTMISEWLNDNETQEFSLWEPWSNIHIQAPMAFVENDYKKDVCDFWDSLDFYVESGDSPVFETTTSAAAGGGVSLIEMSMLVVVAAFLRLLARPL